MDSVTDIEASKVLDPTDVPTMVDPSTTNSTTLVATVVPPTSDSARHVDDVTEVEDEVFAESNALEQKRLARWKRNISKRNRKKAKKDENAEAAKQLKALTERSALVDSGEAERKIEVDSVVERVETTNGFVSQSAPTSELIGAPLITVASSLAGTFGTNDIQVRMMMIDSPTPLAINTAAVAIAAHQDNTLDKPTSTSISGHTKIPDDSECSRLEELCSQVKGLKDQVNEVKGIYEERELEWMSKNTDLMRSLKESNDRIRKEVENHTATTKRLITSLDDHLAVCKELKLSRETVEDLKQQLMSSQSKRINDINSFEKRAKEQLVKFEEGEKRSDRLLQLVGLQTKDLKTCKENLEAERSKVLELSNRLVAAEKSPKDDSSLQQQLEEQDLALNQCKAELEEEKAESLEITKRIESNAEEVAKLRQEVEDQARIFDDINAQLEEAQVARDTVAGELASLRKVDKLVSKIRTMAMVVSCISVAAFWVGSASLSPSAQSVAQIPSINTTSQAITIPEAYCRFVAASTTEVALPIETSLQTTSTAIPDEFWITIQNSIAINMNYSFPDEKESGKSIDSETCPIDTPAPLRNIPTGPLLRKVAVVVGVPLAITVAAISFCWF
ncbi:hypothetical protein BKA65DRAFT_550967 [Rhexocercosporidium sp. MPI-PUGE-AT-0058]|nr:hypothetical protein BKA65DRAFT_550967 [Rhexocercosporidium sp. MPI-PUGE-AT-0058]